MLSKFKHFVKGKRGVLSLAVLVNAAFGLYPAPLFDEDEGFTAEVAREMLEKKEFVLLESNFEPRYDKPPLAFWVIAGALAVGGNNEIAVRTPGILASLVLQYLLFAFMRKRYGEDRAVNNGLLVAGALQFSVMSKSAIADPLLYLFVTAGILSLLRYAENGHKRELYLFMVFNALGFLTKGPVVLFISGVAVLAVAVRRRKARFVGQVLQPVPVLTFLALVLPWFLAGYAKVGMLLIEDFFFTHNVGRFSQPMEGHSGSVFYYFVVFLVGFLPFSFVHLYGLYRASKSKPDLVTTVCVTVFATVFVFFTLSATKLPHYLMLGFFPLTMVSSRYFSVRGRQLSGILAASFIAVLILLPSVAVQWIPKISDAYARLLIAGFPDVFGPLYYGVQLICVVGAVYAIQKKNAAYVVFFLVSVNTTLIAYSTLQQGPVKELAARVDTPVVMPNHYLPSFSFYRQQAHHVREPVAGEYAVGKITDFRQYEYDLRYEKYGTVWVQIKGPKE